MPDTLKSIPHILEDLIGIDGTSPKIKQIFKVTGATTSNPTDFSSTQAVTNATVALTGVAVGDIVLGAGLVSGIAAGAWLVGAAVTATDVVTVTLGAPAATLAQGAVVVNVLVADVT
jgi:hypothetical protein